MSVLVDCLCALFRCRPGPGLGFWGCRGCRGRWVGYKCSSAAAGSKYSTPANNLGMARSDTMTARTHRCTLTQPGRCVPLKQVLWCGPPGYGTYSSCTKTELITPVPVGSPTKSGLCVFAMTLILPATLSFALPRDGRPFGPWQTCRPQQYPHRH